MTNSSDTWVNLSIPKHLAQRVLNIKYPYESQAEFCRKAIEKEIIARQLITEVDVEVPAE